MDCLANTGTNVEMIAFVAGAIIASGCLLLVMRRNRRLMAPIIVAGIVMSATTLATPSYAVEDCSAPASGAAVMDASTVTTPPVVTPPPSYRAPVASDASGIPFSLDGDMCGNTLIRIRSGANLYSASPPYSPDAIAINNFSNSFVTYDGATINRSTIDLDPSIPGIQQNIVEMVGDTAPEPMTISYNPVDDTIRFEYAVDYTNAYGGPGRPLNFILGPGIPFAGTDSNGQLSNVARILFIGIVTGGLC